MRVVSVKEPTVSRLAVATVQLRMASNSNRPCASLPLRVLAFAQLEDYFGVVDDWCKAGAVGGIPVLAGGLAGGIKLSASGAAQVGAGLEQGVETNRACRRQAAGVDAFVGDGSARAPTRSTMPRSRRGYRRCCSLLIIQFCWSCWHR